VMEIESEADGILAGIAAQPGKPRPKSLEFSPTPAKPLRALR